MGGITRVGVDLAKSITQIHAVDAAGKVVTNRPLPRNKFMAWCVQLPSGCAIAMEASSSAHTFEGALASTRMTRRGRRPWHVRTLRAREPGDLQFDRWRQCKPAARIGKARSRSR